MRLSIFTSLLLLLLTSCSTGPDSTSSNPAKTAADNPSKETKAKPSKRAYTQEELNQPYSTVSPWRYLITSPDAMYFEKMATLSSHARTIHASGHTLLLPRDQTFLEDKTWKGIMEEETREVLDRFVGAHIIKGIQSPKGLIGVYEDLNGNAVVIETRDDGEQICGGARLLGQVVETDNGIVIPVMGMVEDIRWD